MTAESGAGRQWPGLTESDEGVRSINISAAVAVAEVVRSTLGPMGMDKLLIDDDGMGIVTNDGATVIKQMSANPVVELVRAAARGQEQSRSDGTTTTAVLTGRLLAEAETLLDQGLHPATVVRGYETACARTTDALRETAIDVDPDDADLVRAVATTASTNKGITSNDEVLADLVVDVVDRIADDDGLDPDDVYVEKEPGGWVEQSGVANNVVLDTGRTSAGMPHAVTDVALAVVDEDVGVTDLRADGTASVVARSDVEEFQTLDRQSLDELVDALRDVGADVLIAGGKIDEAVRHALADADVYAAERTPEETLAQVAGSTGATVVHDPRNLDRADLGRAGSVTEILTDGEAKTSIEDFDGKGAVTLVLRGSQMNLLDELHRALQDSLEAVRTVLAGGGVVPGGGAGEIAAARSLRAFADGVTGREQLAVGAFADALETIPATLVENAGRDPIDGVVDLRASQERDGPHVGVDGYTGEPVDVVDRGVLDPLDVRVGAVEGATQAARTILRIDEALPTASDEE